MLFLIIVKDIKSTAYPWREEIVLERLRFHSYYLLFSILHCYE